jgi:hypothetical protein
METYRHTLRQHVLVSASQLIYTDLTEGDRHKVQSLFYVQTSHPVFRVASRRFNISVKAPTGLQHGVLQICGDRSGSGNIDEAEQCICWCGSSLTSVDGCVCNLYDICLKSGLNTYRLDRNMHTTVSYFLFVHYIVGKS